MTEPQYYQLMTHVTKLGAGLDRLAARLEHIEQSLGTPGVYSHKQACSRLGFSAAVGYRCPERLPEPVSASPLADVERLLDD